LKLEAVKDEEDDEKKKKKIKGLEESWKLVKMEEEIKE